MAELYLVKRGPRPSFHKAPFHPVVLCGRRYVAEWEANWSGDRAWVWSHARGEGVSGWLLERWNGLDIDYGHIVRGFALPDGTQAGIDHDRTREPWTLLAGAAWWDHRLMPAWCEQAGVVYPADEFSRESIARAVSYGPKPNGQPEPELAWQRQAGERAGGRP